MEQLNTTNNGKGNGKSKLFAIIIIVLLLIVAVFGVSIVYLLKTQNNSKEKEEKRNVLVTEDNAEEFVEEIIEEKETSAADPGYYTVTMEPTWTFKTGDAESQNAVIINKESNATPVYVDIFLEEDESQVIYKSPIIPLGGELRNIKLDVNLPAGHHACVAEYHLIDDDQNTISTVRIGMTIVVEN